MLLKTDLRHTHIYLQAMQQGFKEGYSKGFKEGFKEGFEKGRVDELETIAHRMLKLKWPLPEIAEATGLTVARIRQMQKKRPRR